MPSFNLISGQYPFVECLILALPLVDEMIICDNNSNDGTLDIFKKLSFEDNRIKLLENKSDKNTTYQTLDQCVENAIQHASGDWIIIFHSDEFFHPKQHRDILKQIKYCEVQGFNSIRHSINTYNQFLYLGELKPHNNTVRIFKNKKDKRIKSGGLADCFYFEKENHTNKKGYHHNLYPEIESLDIVVYNLLFNFPLCSVIRFERHYYDLTNQSDKGRLDRAKTVREELNLKSLTRNQIINLDPSSLKSSYEENGKIDNTLPAILHDLSKMKKYQIRKELFDLIKNYKKIKI